MVYVEFFTQIGEGQGQGGDGRGREYTDIHGNNTPGSFGEFSRQEPSVRQAVHCYLAAVAHNS